MIADDDDDTHFCLKCHMTVIGLDNYINHRKQGCSRVQAPIEDDRAKSPVPSSVLSNDETFSCKADDFFSSLELRSSSKKQPPLSTGGKHGVLTRSKATAAIQASSKEYQTPIKSDWIGGHQLRVASNVDNETKLIKAVADLSRNTVNKEEPRSKNLPNLRDDYEESEDDSNDDYEDEDEDSEDEDAPPRSHTGGKWKPTTSPVQWMSQDRDWNRPPPSHTGGKWKPVPPLNLSASMKNVPPPGHTKGKWKPDEKNFPPPSHTKGKWKPGGSEEKNVSVPPPTHTKGKWKPADKDIPPPNHTKGKWIPTGQSQEYGITDLNPPLRKSNGTVQYWCGPCNRRLASKIVYERHLKSDLHYKRTFQECEFDDASTYLSPSQSSARIKEKRKQSEPPPSDSAAEVPKTDQTKNRRKRKKTFVKCEVCRSRVYLHLMGKHLISHYHCRKGDLRSPQAQKLVLNNIHNVVLQCPYQCASCKFYCNTQEEFLNHWRSAEHTLNAKTTNGIFWCTFCQFQCHTSEVMEDHLTSAEHSEVISVINRSVPIVIRRVTPLDCQTCGEQFLHNIQLRRHCAKLQHHGVTSSDEHQKRYNCSKCAKTYKTKIGLQKHLRKAHVFNEYLCTACNKSFKNRSEALAHRRTKEHKYTTIKKRQEQGLDKRDMTKICSYCNLKVQNVLVLKEHLREKHPEHKHSCPLCGETFIISQEVASHIKSKACSFKSQEEQTSKAYSCVQCPYKSDSQSEYLFHATLHTKPLEDYDDTKKSMPHYECPVCSKPFSKQYLRCHIRMHTKERPFVCSVCNAGFIRKSNLIHHKRLHQSQPSTSTQTKPLKEYPCNVCGAKFKKRSILQLHMTRHSGKQFRCPISGCSYLARTPTELQPHLATHSDLRPYACQQCDYRAKTKQLLARHSSIHSSWKRYTCPHCNFSSRLATHLNRHLRLHTGEKPYSCPHCEYRCNNLENLRKHILSTNKHPGKHIYECKFCNGYGSNFAKDFKLHLVNEHTDRFESFNAAASYVAGIYDVDSTSSGGSGGGGGGGAATATAAKQTQFAFEILKPSTSKSIGKSVATKPSSLANDPVVNRRENIGSAILLTSAANQDVGVNSKDDVIYIELPSTDNEQWSMTANYDVDESGTLVVPFQTEGDSLFQEHFHETL